MEKIVPRYIWYHYLDTENNISKILWNLLWGNFSTIVWNFKSKYSNRAVPTTQKQLKWLMQIMVDTNLLNRKVIHNRCIFKGCDKRMHNNNQFVMLYCKMSYNECSLCNVALKKSVYTSMLSRKGKGYHMLASTYRFFILAG